jgi:DNA-binding winged helix-turn-helix (wHTH) protein
MPTESDREYDLSFGDFTIVRADERVFGPAGPIKLGRKAYRLLLMLAEQDGQLLTKDDLFATVWDGTIVSESALTSVVKELRRALDDPSVNPRYIESVYGRGYRLLAPVARRSAGQGRAAIPEDNSAGLHQLGDAPLLYMPPFDDKAVAAAHPFLGSVLHEELLIALSRFREIRLVSDQGQADRHGPRDYRLSMRLVAHEGSIQAFVRTARLATGAIVWAEQLPLPPGNPIDTVEEIARRVAGAVMSRLRDDMLRNVPHQPVSAYDRYFANRRRMRDLETLEEARAVAEEWERLIADHPELHQAYPPLIRLYNTDYGLTGPGACGATERRRAYELAHRAIAIDPTDSHLHTVKAWCHLWAGEAGLARAHLDEAQQLNPSHQERLVEIATGMMFLDELDRAAGLLERCRSLAVFASDAPQEEEGLLLLLQQDYGKATEALALARWVHPDDRVKARPGLLTDLYALLAAAGNGAADLAARARDWRARTAARWAGPEPLDDARLRQWILFHNPFQREERRQWLLSLAERAFAAGAADEPSRPVQATPERPSVSG